MLNGVLDNLGLMSLITLLIFLISVRVGPPSDHLVSRITLGVLLASMAVIVVRMPVRLPDGATFDLRAAPVVLAGFFGGPVSGLLAASGAALARYSVGGPAVIGGVVSPFLYMLAGLLGALIVRRLKRKSMGAFGFLALGGLASLFVLPSFFLGVMPDFALGVLGKLWPYLVGGNLIGILVLGLLIEETLRIGREREEFKRTSLAAMEGLQAKSRFLSAISHDIRTPLNGVLGALQLLNSKMTDSGDRNLVQVALRSGRYLMELVDQILDYAKVENSFVIRSDKVFTLSQLVEGVHSLFDDMIKDRNLSLSIEIESGEATLLLGDYDNIRHVLYNIVGNAVKYTEKGSISITGSCRQTAPRMAELFLAVRDTGPGIDPSDQERIFEQFVRLKQSSMGVLGSGLGLSIARGLVEKMGGTLQVESALGQGACFSIRLPIELANSTIANQSIQTSPASMESPRSGAAAAPTLPAMSILVVDDNNLNCQLLREALVQMGHRVTLADSGSAAIAAIRAAPAEFDLVLMDIQMPDITGDEATQIIRSTIPEARTLPILAVTANAFSDQRDRYLKAGMSGVVTKPIEFDRLVAVMGAARQSVRADAPSPTAQGPSLSGGGPTGGGGHDSDPVLDTDQIASLRRYMSEEKVQQLIDESLRMIHRRLDQMAEAVKTEDRPGLRALAHEMKGMAGNIGLMRISRAALPLQLLDNCQNAAQALETLTRAVAETDRALSTGTPGPKPTGTPSQH